MRAGAVFHDGSPLTAEAAVAGLRRAFRRAGVLNQAPIETIGAEAERDVVVRLTKPFASLPAFVANYRSIVLAPASYDDKGEAI